MNTNLQSSERYGQDQFIPFLWLRRGIGGAGILFPIVLVLGANLFSPCTGFLSSISDYYHTNMQNIFVGFLSLIALFLFTYRGPKDEDKNFANAACLFCLGIAYCPDSIKSIEPMCIYCNVTQYGVNSFIHNFCAISFFLVLSYFSLCLFPKTNPDIPPTPEKLKRNTIYKFAGYIMLGCIVMIILGKILKSQIPFLQTFPYVFIFESLALWAFGISWMVKGETFLKDKS